MPPLLPTVPPSGAGRPGAVPTLLALLALGGLALLGGCLGSGPVFIGFSGPLTGRWADLGVQGRNGATLAVEDLNARSGVAGRPVELLVADEGETPEAAAAAVRSLEAQGAAVLVGFMTSAAALAGLPWAEEAGLAVVSPSAATTWLTGLDDFFFRVIPDVAAYARFQAEGVARRHPGGRVLAVQDQGNLAFAAPYHQAFAGRLAELGGEMADAADIGAQPDGRALAARARQAGAAAVLALLPARALARVVLDFRAEAQGQAIYTAMWGFNTEFLEMAGASAEGVASCLIYPFSATSPALDAFTERYRQRFGYVPSSGALLAYEATMAAALGLERTRGRRAGLARALAGLRGIPGICGPFSLDPHGDVLRPLYWAEVRGGSIRVGEDGDG